MVQPMWKLVWRLLKKLKIKLSYNLAIALVGIHPRNPKILMQRDTCTLMCTAALSTIAKLWKQTKCPSTDEWIKTMWCVYIYTYIHTYINTHIHVCMYNGILLIHQKERNLPIYNNRDGAREYNAQQNKEVRERQIPPMCGI